jgi:hypothetical protein
MGEEHGREQHRDELDMTYVRLKNIDRFIDRHGKLRNYYRKGKGQRIALPGEPGSPEFMLAYQTAERNDGSCRAEVRRNRREEGSIGGFRSYGVWNGNLYIASPPHRQKATDDGSP